MSHIMLPKVKKQGFESPTVGTWTPYNLEFLDKLTKSMDVQGVNSQNGNVSSIPDVWAKPLLFEMLLFGENVDTGQAASSDIEESGFSVNLRERVTGEWRCVLAMLALSKVKHLDITVEEVNISDSDNILESVLYKMRPTKTIDIATTWDTLYIIKYKDKPLAMTSPTTLVSVSADYSRDMRGVFDKDSPWAKETDAGVMLIDPTSGLSQKDRNQLHHWLGKLKTNLKENVNGGDSAVLGKLLRCIDSFVIDVRGTRSNGIDCEIPSQVLKIYKGIFKYLDTPVKEENVTAEDSQVMICPSASKVGKRWLLVDAESLNRMAVEWDINKSRITVWSGISANNITDDMLNDEDRGYIGKAELVNAEWVKAEDFFTEYVYVADGLPQVFINVFDPGAKDKGVQDNQFSIVPPINKRVLEYFSMEDITRRFHLRFEENGDIVASFDLPFKYRDKSGREEERQFKIEKRYSENDESHCCFQEYVPIAEIWPNRRLTGWNKYYFCYINYLSGGKQEVVENSLLLTPWSREKGETDSQGKQIDCLSNKYTVQLNAFPEAMICSVFWKNEGYSPKKVDVGLLIINPPEQLEYNPDRVWNVGIDFGTSNTMLYYKQGNDTPQPLSFESNLYSLIKQRPGDRAVYLIGNFVWPEEKLKNGSFLTIYNVIQQNADRSKRVEPLIDGNVFSLASDKLASLGNMARNMVPNLKWASAGNSGENVTRKQKLAEAYIEQICMQTAFEAAKFGVENINWNFSYPTAFSSKEKTYFIKMTGDAVKSAMDATPYGTKENKINALCEESVATATYFNKMDNKQGSNFVGGAICVDIGAGTTDISVIAADPVPHIAYHASAQYAGRIFFSAVFAWLEFFLEPEDKEELQKETDDDKKRAMLDSVMRDKSEEYLDKMCGLLVGGGENIKLVEAMLQIPQLAMTGLFYYIGIVLRLLREYKIFDRDIIPDIYVGGNGSRIFRWIEGAVKDHDCKDKHLQVMRRAVVASSGMLDDGFKIDLSKTPKMEVAAGMLVKENNTEWFNEKEINRRLFGDNPDEYAEKSLVSGESFQVGDEVVDAYEFLNALDIHDGVVVKDLPYIKDMVDVFNERPGDIWSKTIDITRFERDLIRKTAGYYLNEKQKNPEDIHVEPVFLVAMKVLVDILLGELREKLEAEK